MEPVRKMLVLICLAFVISCKDQNKKINQSIYNREAIKLNEIAMKLFQNNHANQDSILTTINLLKQAIQKDSSYYIAYSNLASLLCYTNNINEAINTLDRILVIDPSLIEIKTTKGFFVEKSGNNSKAFEIYKNIIVEYDKKISGDSTNITLKLNRAFLFFFTEGQDRAINEFNKISERYPNNVEVNNRNEVFISFNRQAYIESLCLN